MIARAPSTIAEIEADLGAKLSNPSKLPGYAFGTPARRCKRGSILARQAGTTCRHCYALRGRYRFPNVEAAAERRFEAFSHPGFVPLMSALITRKDAGLPEGRRGFFRWYDSGDLQSVQDLRSIVLIAERTPEVRHWLPTREHVVLREYQDEYGRTLPGNLCIRRSMTMVQQPAPTGRHVMYQYSTVGVSDGFQCPAKSFGNTCGPCRACWDRTRRSVNYPLRQAGGGGA